MKRASSRGGHDIVITAARSSGIDARAARGQIDQPALDSPTWRLVNLITGYANSVAIPH